MMKTCRGAIHRALRVLWTNVKGAINGAPTNLPIFRADAESLIVRFANLSDKNKSKMKSTTTHRARKDIHCFLFLIYFYLKGRRALRGDDQKALRLCVPALNSFALTLWLCVSVLNELVQFQLKSAKDFVVSKGADGLGFALEIHMRWAAP